MTDSVRIEDFSQLAAMGSDVSRLQEHAARAQRRLESAMGSAVAVGAYPAGQAFASHHDAVAQVMATTMNGMGIDIETFGSNIVTSAHSWRDGEENATSCLRSIHANLSAANSVDDTFDAALEDQRDSLVDVNINADDAQAGGASEQTTQMLRSSTDHEAPESATPATSANDVEGQIE